LSVIWYICRSFGIFVGSFGIFVGHLVHFSRFSVSKQEKSGNPAAKPLLCVISFVHKSAAAAASKEMLRLDKRVSLTNQEPILRT
jgi:hypothetical protein